MCCSASWGMHCRLLAQHMLSMWSPWIGNVLCQMEHGTGRTCRHVFKITHSLIQTEECE